MHALCWAEEFLVSEQAAGKAPATLRNRRAALEKLDAWLVTRDAPSLDAEARLTPADLREFVNGLRARLSEEHVNTVIGALRVYFRWCVEEGLRETNPAARLKFLRPAPRLVESLSQEQVQRLVRTASRVRPRERFGVHRSAALAMLLLDTGLRIGEAVRLRLYDLHLGENGDGRLTVRAPKTRGLRVVALTPALRVHLQRYLRRRALRLALLSIDTDLLFFTEQGRPLSVDRAEEGIRRLGERAKLGRRLHPHLLRHTWATLSLTNGAPLPAVMRLGGWRKLETVQRYTHFSDDAAVAVHRATSPLAAKGGGRR